MRTARRLPEPPQQMGEHQGLSFARFFAPGVPWGSVLILHGADSCKESHFEFARAARAAGMDALAFDQRGHGASGGCFGDSILADLAAMAGLLSPGPLALRGSSMGAYTAIVAASALGARAVVAICPAPSELLLGGLRDGRYQFAAAREPLEAFLAGHDLLEAARTLPAPLLLMHAEGDERVPAAYSAELAAARESHPTRLLVLPGGHHRSIQHDPELHGESLRFLRRALRGEGSSAGRPPTP